ncbi:lipoma-preferred partner homolog [Mya arenaria]|uniref:lipoma-preferred partner homolog n=1 Tax=Mya arenaria TaxID=6604 RepID=UPI0022E94D91|nr:lipoma-preferred partner homolog [Mya arenaria]
MDLTDQDFQRLTLHESRSQITPPVGKKPAPTYRAGPAPYRSYHDNKEEFMPPPPPPTSAYMDQNFPPPPPETKENIYHEIQDADFPPPPLSSGQSDFRGPEPMYAGRSSGYTQYGGPAGSSYESRQEVQTLHQPSGRYEREVKQATYSIQSTDSSGKSSPRSSPYATNYSSTGNYGGYTSQPSTYSSGSYDPGIYKSSPVSYGQPQTYSSNANYSQYSSNRAPSPLAYTSSPSNQDGSSSGVTYASLADTGVTYAQVKPRSERAQPGPQMPIQIKVQDVHSDNTYMQPSPAQYQRHSPSQQSYAPPPIAPMQASRPSLDPRGGAGGEPRGGTGSKEQEVDALTQMLMQGLEGTKDPDFYGICAKCGKKVVGESNGCTAMDQVFHIGCFICISCGTLLRGRSFYSMETKPHCEPCYLNTLEKCSICSKPVTDRLLRATGKPYHPACFTCVVCGISLDGIPFTVDATNQIHCIEDFHRKFAPRCCVCHKPIMPEQGQESTVRVVAMDKSFHIDCYRCEDCGDLLSSEAEGRGCYPLDDHILCKPCNAKRINALTTKLSTEL